MSHVMTAEELLYEFKAMPFRERGRFFSILGEQFFQHDNFTHQQVFGHLVDDEFSSKDAAEYLEVSIATFRRYVQKGKLKPSHVHGRSQMFATNDLKRFKRALSVRLK